MNNLKNQLSAFRSKMIELKIEGDQDKVIADKLSRSVETIKYHWKQMQDLFGVKTTLQVCVMAVQIEQGKSAANDDHYKEAA